MWVSVCSTISWTYKTFNWSLCYKMDCNNKERTCTYRYWIWKKTYKKTWISGDKLKHCLGFFTTTRLIQDWKTAEPNEVLLSKCTWGHFLKKLQSYYEPTKNPIIWNFDFRQKWRKWETFCAFFNRVEAVGKTCTLCECNSDCSAEEYAIHDQIVIGRTNENICKKARIKSLNLAKLRQKGMKYESTAAGKEKISGFEANKVGAYSYQRIKNENTKLPTKKCCRCDSSFSTKM